MREITPDCAEVPEVRGVGTPGKYGNLYALSDRCRYTINALFTRTQRLGCTRDVPCSIEAVS